MTQNPGPPQYKQFATSCITRSMAQLLGHRICNKGIPGSNPMADDKCIFLFILLNKMHITFYQKQSHGEHVILALLHFSCVISCNIRVFKHNHIDNMSKQKSNHFLSSKAKEIIFNVSDAFEKEQTPGSGSFLDRTAKVTGVSRSTVDRVRREKKETGILLSPKKTTARGPYKPIDGFEQSAIRQKITEFYTVRRQLPTLKSLHQSLTEDIQFPGSVETLRKILHNLGYR